MGFSHSIQVVGHISHKVVGYRSDSMGKGSVDEKVVVYGSGMFVTGVVQTRDCCIGSWATILQQKHFSVCFMSCLSDLISDAVIS